MKDYQVTLVEDCCAAASTEEHEATLLNISKFFGDVAKADTVLSGLRAPLRKLERFLLRGKQFHPWHSEQGRKLLAPFA
jgi:hypothetical protein